MSINRHLYHDDGATLYGDGFYPRLSPSASASSKRTVLFTLQMFDNRLSWCQKSGPAIIGFDDNIGVQLLVSLNMEGGHCHATRIVNSGGRTIFPRGPNSTYRILKQIA